MKNLRSINQAILLVKTPTRAYKYKTSSLVGENTNKGAQRAKLIVCLFDLENKNCYFHFK
jgi:hypothetical protein